MGLKLSQTGCFVPRRRVYKKGRSDGGQSGRGRYLDYLSAAADPRETHGNNSWGIFGEGLGLEREGGSWPGSRSLLGSARTFSKRIGLETGAAASASKYNTCEMRVDRGRSSDYAGRPDRLSPAPSTLFTLSISSVKKK